MEKKTFVTTASPINAPLLNGSILTYLTAQEGKHYLVNVNLDTMGMESTPVEWDRVDGASLCETYEGKIYYSEPLEGKLHMLQPNGDHSVINYPLELNDVVTRTLFKRPALAMTSANRGRLSAALLVNGEIREEVLVDNVQLAKGMYSYNNIGSFDGNFLFEERNYESGEVKLGYVKNERFVRMPTAFQGYLPAADGVLAYKLGSNGMVSHLCLLTEESIVKAINGDVRDLKRETKLKFNTKTVFGQHGCGIIPHCSLDDNEQYAAMVGESGTNVLHGTKIVTVAQPINGVLVTKGDLVVAIDVRELTDEPTMPAATDIDVDAPTNGDDW